MSPRLLRPIVEPPLDPSPGEARTWLGRELARPEYHDRELVQQFLAWVDRFVGSSLDAAAGSPPLSALAAIVVFLALSLALAWLLSRARRTAGTRRSGDVLAARRISADELRARAVQAHAEGHHRDAVVDGFRAMAVRQVERGELEDLPGTTAHEVALAVGGAHPEQRDRVAAGAALFDAVLYGERTPSFTQAAEVLALDDVLAGRR